MLHDERVRRVPGLTLTPLTPEELADLARLRRARDLMVRINQTR